MLSSLSNLNFNFTTFLESDLSSARSLEFEEDRAKDDKALYTDADAFLYHFSATSQVGAVLHGHWPRRSFIPNWPFNNRKALFNEFNPIAVPIHERFITGQQYEDSKYSVNKVDSVWDLFVNSCLLYSDSKLFGRRQSSTDGAYCAYTWYTYSDILESVYRVSESLNSLGFIMSNMGIMSANRCEWIICQLAGFRTSIKSIPIHCNLATTGLQHIIKHSRIKSICIDHTQVRGLINALRAIKASNDVFDLSTIFFFDSHSEYGGINDVLTDSDLDAFHELGLDIVHFSSLLNIPAVPSDKELPILPIVAADVCMIYYTSGTTGLSKGAQLSHKNFLSQMTALSHGFSMHHSWCYYSYLPSSHIYDSVFLMNAWASGARIAFASNAIHNVLDDLREAQPDCLIGVPRIYNKWYQAILNDMNNAAKYFNGIDKQGIYEYYNIQAQLFRLNRQLDMQIDVKIFEPIRKHLGLNNVKLCATGSALISPKIFELFNLCRLNLKCVYGLTETTCLASVSDVNDRTSSGHVGTPLGDNEIKLVSVPELNYTTEDKPFPRGEVYIRGSNVFCGYLNDPAATNAAFPFNDGWFASGDIGRWNANGTLSIIDRKKNVTKMSQGEFICPELIEQRYLSSPYISQIWVYADSRRDFPVAVIVPNMASISSVISHPNDSLAWIQELRKLISDEIVQVESSTECSSLEKIRAFHLELEVDANGLGFTQEKNCMTPTSKLKRQRLEQQYKEQIEKLYTKTNSSRFSICQ